MDLEPALATIVIPTLSSNEYDSDGPSYAAIRLTAANVARIKQLMAATQELNVRNIEDNWDVLWLGRIPRLASLEGVRFIDEDTKDEWEAWHNGDGPDKIDASWYDAEFLDFRLDGDKLIVHGNRTVWWECYAKHGTDSYSTQFGVSTAFLDTLGG